MKLVQPINKAAAEAVAVGAGKVITDTIGIAVDGSDFDITAAIEKVLKNLVGYNIGTLCRDEPRALSKTANYIAKWRNIPASEYYKMDGVVMCKDNRNGKAATIYLFTEAVKEDHAIEDHAEHVARTIENQ